MNFTDAQALLTFGAMLVIIFATPIYKLNNYIKAHTRNEHVKTAMNWANQAVAALVNSDLNTLPNRQKAVADLTERISNNKLAGHFTQQEIESYVEKAIADLNK